MFGTRSDMKPFVFGNERKLCSRVVYTDAYLIHIKTSSTKNWYARISTEIWPCRLSFMISETPKKTKIRRSKIAFSNELLRPISVILFVLKRLLSKVFYTSYTTQQDWSYQGKVQNDPTANQVVSNNFWWMKNWQNMSFWSLVW